jgi:integrase
MSPQPGFPDPLKFAKAARDAGVTVSRPYDLRHSAASLWLAEGMNAVQVAAWMGHSLQELSKTYAHVIADLDPDDRRNAVDMVQDARQDDHRTTFRVLTGAKQSGRRRAATASG